MNRTVLQISNDFMHQEVYTQLIGHLEARGIPQWVFVAAREADDVRRCPPDTVLTRYAVRHVLRRHHKLLFGVKVRAMLRALEGSFDVSKAALMHAHFLYTDGAVAFDIHRRFGIPYVVSVRPTTDIFAFMRYRPDLLGLAVRILRAASSVVCLTPAGRDLLLSRIPRSERDGVRRKINLVPSAIGTVWHDAPASVGISPAGTIRLLSVSDMSPNKNVPAVLAAARTLVKRGLNVTLTLVGGSPERLPRRLDPWVTHIPHTRDREALRNLFRQHDVFVLPSFAETFGLVYVEALSQGLPVIHSRGQAIDGLFPEGIISEPVDPRSPDSIADAAARLTSARPGTWQRCIDETRGYRWPLVAERVHAIYRDAGLPDSTTSLMGST
jgi:glycosyltransferase involved in cell wall biosynthesis